MPFYSFERKQLIHAPKDAIWDFISRPFNLKTITPTSMGFEVISKDLPDKMYEGMIVVYKVSPLWGIRTTWVTEITQVHKNNYFVDEQRMGPYKIWHHQHFLEQTDKGTLMRDIVSYQPPFGILGQIANRFIIRKKLEQIFEYRKNVLDDIYK